MPMDVTHNLLHYTAFRAPLLRTIVPTVGLALVQNVGTFLVVLPLVVLQKRTEIGSYAGNLASDAYALLSGSTALTSPICVIFSFFLPYLRARESNRASGIPWLLSFGDYFGAPGPGLDGWWWRQGVLSAFAVLAGMIGRATLPRRYRYTPWNDYADLFPSSTNTKSLSETALALSKLCLKQTLHTSIALLPIMAVNAIPRVAFTAARLRNVYDKIPSPIPLTMYATDFLGLGMFASGMLSLLYNRVSGYWEAMDVLQTGEKSKEVGVQNGAATTGELGMWSGIAVMAAGLLVQRQALTGLGLSLGGCTFDYDILDSGLGGRAAMLGLCVGSLAYVGWEAVKRYRCEGD